LRFPAVYADNAVWQGRQLKLDAQSFATLPIWLDLAYPFLTFTHQAH
jgi:hypothetical protein